VDRSRPSDHVIEAHWTVTVSETGAPASGSENCAEAEHGGICAGCSTVTVAVAELLVPSSTTSYVHWAQPGTIGQSRAPEHWAEKAGGPPPAPVDVEDVVVVVPVEEEDEDVVDVGPPPCPASTGGVVVEPAVPTAMRLSTGAGCDPQAGSAAAMAAASVMHLSDVVFMSV